MHMSARGLTFKSQHTANRVRPQRRWRYSGKSAKTFEILMFSAWDPLSPADSLPNPLTVIENTSKRIVKQSKINVSVCAHFAVPWPCVGDAPEEDVNSYAESLKTL